MSVKNMLRKPIKIFTVATLIIMLLLSQTVYATTPYEGYNYDYWTDSLKSPLAYIPESRISGEMLGLENFIAPADVYVRNDKIYLLDSGRGRVVIFDKDCNVYSVINTYMYNGEETRFNNPTGIYVTEDEIIYVADTDNLRVVVFDSDGALIQLIQDPKSEMLSADFEFRPMKLAVDDSGRLYVIAKNVFEGIMCFDSTGSFYGYFGTIKVAFNPLDWFWRQLSTKAQRAQLTLFIPTEFSGIDIDNKGFIYATNIDKSSGEDFIKRLNMRGQNVIVNYNANKKLVGDYTLERSTFKDIKYRGDGMYCAMDFTKGRIFTYDSEGNMLYVFGGVGTEMGMAKKPVAVETLSDDTMIVLDQDRGELLLYETTEYGRTINQAIRLRYNGNEAEAVALWERVLEMDANNQLAYVGLGKSYLASNDNKKAMEYLKKGMDVTYYSVAYKRYRNDTLRQNLPVIMTGAIVIIASYVGYRMFKRRKGEVEVEA